jgi:hypothetical protein
MLTHSEEMRCFKQFFAAQKYYEGVVAQYFDRANRFALEPFERKLDRHNQKVLLNRLLTEARDVRRRITTNEIGGTYFVEITNPPVSHFAVSPKLERMLASLEMNFLVSKYLTHFVPACLTTRSKNLFSTS